MAPSQPNGIGFSEDETILYVSDTDKKNIGIYKNDLSSSLTELMPQPKPTDFVSAFSLNIPLFNSDGFFVDHYIWTSQQMGVDVIDTITMGIVARIYMGTSISNIAKGNNGDVFITGAGHVWRLKTSKLYQEFVRNINYQF